MDIGALATWAQSQGPFVKLAMVTVIVIIAGIVVSVILKPAIHSKPHSPVDHTVAPPQIAKQQVTKTRGDQPKETRTGTTSSDKKVSKSFEVNSINQSGGVTAGEIGNLTIGGGEN